MDRIVKYANDLYMIPYHGKTFVLFIVPEAGDTPDMARASAENFIFEDEDCAGHA